MGFLTHVFAWFLGYLVVVLARQCLLVIFYGIPFLKRIKGQGALLSDEAFGRYRFSLITWTIMIVLFVLCMVFWMPDRWLTFGIGFGLAVLITFARLRSDLAGMLYRVQPAQEFLDHEKLKQLYPEAYPEEEDAEEAGDEVEETGVDLDKKD